MGSVKELEVIKEPTQKEMGIGRFHFSDRYSVFDWGVMPDLIQDKGSSLCMMGAYCFERLEEEGIKTHYRGLITKEWRLVRTDELKEPTNIMEIDLVRVIHPRPIQKGGKIHYDYSEYGADEVNFLIPLEIIYRNSLPKGSSIFNRLRSGEIKPSDLGFDHMPNEGEELSIPFLDLSTKLETKDRYVSFDEAKEISGLRDAELHKIKDWLNVINVTITKIAVRIGLRNEDGKIEFAFNHKRELIVVDVVGTLDECRFTYNGIHVSKEVLREYYKDTQWYDHLLEAKKKAEAKGIEDWKGLCRSKPPMLDKRLLRIVSDMYRATTNEWIGSKFFDTPPLHRTIDEYKDYIASKGSPR